MLQRHILLSLSLLAPLVSGCGRDPEVGAETTNTPDSTGRTFRDSAAGYVVVDTPPPSPSPADSVRAARDSVSLAGDSVAVVADTTAAGDTVKPPDISVRMAPGRPKRDSLALTYAVKAAGRHQGWPVKGPAPARGALLPGKRIVAFYGNPLSKRMGILGEIPPDQMLAKLEGVAAEWQEADPGTPVQPALHYIAVVAQAGPGSDGKYRLRMDSSAIEEVYGWAQRKNAILFLDIQTGLSTVMEELPRLMKFLERPDVHLGVDPEFHMHYTASGVPPGKKIGSLGAKEVNYLIEQLAKLVEEKGLPPKVLVIHRFTRPMLRGASEIRLDPRVQVVIDMDGWGPPYLKFDSYKDYVISEPVQFTGFKIFYKNDTKRGDGILTPLEVLQLKPRPSYIQYQ